MKRILFIIFIFLITVESQAQEDVYMTITPFMGDEPFVFNVESTNDLGHEFTITRLDYYLSNLKIIHDGGTETPVPDMYLLLRGNTELNLHLGSFDVTNVEGIAFNVGVNPPVNNADPTQWPENHPLAPQSPSMHWGWAAGYRFVALEGMAGSAMNTVYQMHGLGNSNYFRQTVLSDGVENENGIYMYIIADYKKALNGINLNAGPIDHGADLTDLTVLENFRDFVFTPGAIILSAEDTNKEMPVKIYPNPCEESSRISWDGASGSVTGIAVYDLTGRKVQQLAVQFQKEQEVFFSEKGIYIVQLQSEGTALSNHKIIVR